MRDESGEGVISGHTRNPMNRGGFKSVIDLD